MAEDKKEVTKFVDFEWNGTTYTMEFNRRTAALLERNFGVNIVKMFNGEVNFMDLPTIFRVSLMMHHPRMKQEVADEIYENLADKQGLMTVLIEMLSYTVMSVFEAPEEGKAISWTRH